MRVRLAGLFASLLALSACGGGGAEGTPVPSHPSGAVGPAAFTFTIPSSAAAARAALKNRKPNTVPISTQSIVVTAMNPNGTPLNPPAQTIIDASACTPITGGLQCAGTIDVPLDTPLLFSIVAYTAANGGGSPLASGDLTTTGIVAGSQLTVSLGTAASYAAMGLGGGIGIVTIDHASNILTTANVSNGQGVTADLTATLPNGFEKFTVASATDGSTIGSIAYAKESPIGALIFAGAGTSPGADGSATTTDADMGAGAGTLLQCTLPSETIPVNVASILGAGYTLASGVAYTSGSATISGGTTPTIAFTGSNYLLSGATASSAGGTQSGCVNGVVGTGATGDVALGLEGVIIVTNGGNSNPSTDDHVGSIGFIAPSSPYSLAALSAVTYDAISGGQSLVNGMLFKHEQPLVLTPSGANTLLGCGYTTFESNVVGTTNCSTVTFTSQPLPGLITGTAVTGGQTANFIGSVGIVNGKYMISVVSVGTSGVNLVLMQH